MVPVADRQQYRAGLTTPPTRVGSICSTLWAGAGHRLALRVTTGESASRSRPSPAPPSREPTCTRNPTSLYAFIFVAELTGVNFAAVKSLAALCSGSRGADLHVWCAGTTSTGRGRTFLRWVVKWDTRVAGAKVAMRAGKFWGALDKRCGRRATALIGWGARHRRDRARSPSRCRSQGC